MDEDVDEDVAKVFTNNKKGKNDVAVINKLNFFLIINIYDKKNLNCNVYLLFRLLHYLINH